jgi:hypothetical protein
MSFFSPDITTPVKLNLTADEAQREALGRTLGLVGTGVGLAGAVMVLMSNPAVKAALAKGAAVDLTVSPEQAKREALGKSLALFGLAVGMTGTTLSMTANPKVWGKMPEMLRSRPMLVTGVLGAALVAGAILMTKAQNKGLVGTRYAKG